MKVRKVYMLANGRFGIDTVDLPDVTVDAALNHLGIRRQSLSPADRAAFVDGCIVVEIAMVNAFTWNRFVFCAAVDEVA